MVYDTGLPSVGTPGAPARQKKKISFAEYQSRPPREDPSQSHAEEAEWQERLRKQQEEVEFRQSKVNRLKWEQEELTQEQECLRAGQEQLDRLQVEQEHLRNKQLERECLEKEQKGCRCRDKERKERQCLEREEREGLHAKQERFRSHTPMYDEHGEALDYLDDLEQSEQNQDTWWHLIADVPINRQLEQARQETLARDLQEAALLQGPTQVAMPTEEETLLLDSPKRTNLDCLVQGLQNLLDSALNQLSQHIDEIRWWTPSLVSPTKPPGLPDSTPQSTNMAWEILRATTSLGQLPSGSRPITEPLGDMETRQATEFLEAQLKAPRTPIRNKESWTDPNCACHTIRDKGAANGFEHLWINRLFYSWIILWLNI